MQLFVCKDKHFVPFSQIFCRFSYSIALTGAQTGRYLLCSLAVLSTPSIVSPPIKTYRGNKNRLHPAHPVHPTTGCSCIFSLS